MNHDNYRIHPATLRAIEHKADNDPLGFLAESLLEYEWFLEVQRANHKLGGK